MTAPVTTDPITTEIIRNFFLSCAQDMNATLFRSAYTPVIYEGLDCAVALLDENADVLGQAAGVPLAPVAVVVARLVALTVVVVAATVMFGRDRGLPLSAVILVGFVVFFDQLTRRTRWGRHLFAVGGNAEAARRAGVTK